MAVSEQPELAPMVARWVVGAFHQRPGGLTVESLTSWILTPDGLEKTFVVFDGTEPAGTASLVRQDLEARPDLTPWLAAVFVEPAFRGRGHASALIRRVEAYAASTGAERLWLYTLAAEHLYARIGWQRAGIERDAGKDVVLMRRTLTDSSTTANDLH